MGGFEWMIGIQGLILFGGIAAIIASYGEFKGRFSSLERRVSKLEEKIDKLVHYLLGKKEG